MESQQHSVVATDTIEGILIRYDISVSHLRVLSQFFIISDAIYNNINLLLAKNTYKNLLYLAALTTITDQMFPK